MYNRECQKSIIPVVILLELVGSTVEVYCLEDVEKKVVIAVVIIVTLVWVFWTVGDVGWIEPWTEIKDKDIVKLLLGPGNSLLPHLLVQYINTQEQMLDWAKNKE